MAVARLYTLFFSLIAVLLFPAVADAREVNAEGAQHLKGIFEDWIKYQKDINSLAGGALYEYEGEVIVEPSGTYYAVTLPHARVNYPDGTRLNLGMVSINASPHDVDGQWKMTLAVPTPIVMFDIDEQPVMRFEIGAQRAAGIWDETLENFYKLDADYQDIRVRNSISDFDLKIPSVQIRYDFSQDDTRRWSGPGWFQLKDISIALPADTGSVDISAVEAQFEVDRYDPAAMKTYREQIVALAETVEAQEDQDISDAHAAGMYNMLYNFFTQAANGFKINYSFSDLHIRKAADAKDSEEGDAKTEEIKIGGGNILFEVGGLMENQVSMAFNTGYNGFSTSMVPAEENVTPTDLQLKFLLKNVPFKELSDLGKNTLNGVIQNPDMGQMAGISLLLKVPAILSQAGTYLELTDNYVAGEGYRFELDGRARADISALNSATADFKAVFRGLDTLLGRARRLAGQVDDPESAEARRYQELVSTLTRIKTHALRTTDLNQKPLYTLQFVMNPEGQMLINGKDAMAVLQGQAEDGNSAVQPQDISPSEGTEQ